MKQTLYKLIVGFDRLINPKDMSRSNLRRKARLTLFGRITGSYLEVNK